jgi:hypothetical protein
MNKDTDKKVLEDIKSNKEKFLEELSFLELDILEGVAGGMSKAKNDNDEPNLMCAENC